MRISVAATLLVLAASSGCASMRMDSAADADAVRARSEALVAAEGAMDFETAITFWAPDAIVQPAGAPQIEGRAAIAELYGSFQTMEVKSFEGKSSHLDVSGDLAYEHGVNRMVFAGPDGDMLDVGKYLAVWKKINGEWMVVALSFTSDAPAPTPVAPAAP